MLTLSLRYIAQDRLFSISVRSGLVSLDLMGVISQVLSSFYVPGDRVRLCLAHQGHRELPFTVDSSREGSASPVHSLF